MAQASLLYSLTSPFELSEGQYKASAAEAQKRFGNLTSAELATRILAHKAIPAAIIQAEH